MKIADLFQIVAGSDAPIEFLAYDGSRSGPSDAAARLEVCSPRALSYFAWAPGAVGLARAYVAGDVQVVGDMYTVIARLVDLSKPRSLTTGERLRVVRALTPYLRRRPKPPPEEVRINRLMRYGRLHTPGRDKRAISHHYDVPNEFYELVLGPSMSYTCACFSSEDATLEEAQSAKHDLIARKLGLEPGMRLLDVGCGWGGMVQHAALHHGVRAVGVTLTPQHAEWAQRSFQAAGVSDLAEVRNSDYRGLKDGGFDAISSMGLTEHLGKAQLPDYFSFLYSRLRPGGRLLNQCITRPDDHDPPKRRTGLINRYVFPDGELESPGYLISLMHNAGFEVRHEENLREHYPPTLAAWSSNLDENWGEAVATAGEGRARVWRMYMAFARIGFERNRLQLHQVLAVKPDAQGRSWMPLRPDWSSEAVSQAGARREQPSVSERVDLEGTGDREPSSGGRSPVAALVNVAVPPLGLLFAMGVLWGVALQPIDVALFLIFYLLTGIGVTVGLHRFFTHRSFETGSLLKAVLAVLGSMAVQGFVTDWVADHRCHHAHSDAEGDPHSPHVGRKPGLRGRIAGLWHAHMGWIFERSAAERRERFARDLLADRLIQTIDRTYVVWVALTLAVPFAVGWAVGGTVARGFEAFVWAGLIRVLLVHHVTWSVNSICHSFGKQPYQARDESHNNWLLALPTLGEAWHNNHHAFPSSAILGLDHGQLDPGGFVIRNLERLGLVWNVHRPDDDQRARRRTPPAEQLRPPAGKDSRA